MAPAGAPAPLAPLALQRLVYIPGPALTSPPHDRVDLCGGDGVRVVAGVFPQQCARHEHTGMKPGMLQTEHTDDIRQPAE